jgi:hypothetical protein
MTNCFESDVRLVPVPGIKSFLRHPARRRDPFNFPFVVSLVAERLSMANAYLK